MIAPRVGTLISALALVVAAAAVPTHAVPTAVPTTADAPAKLHPNVFEVYDPPITAPAAGDVWSSGSQQTVKWDASKIGADGQNTTARLLLGHQDPSDLSEYLDLSTFL